jgi:hypothetical protein
MSQAFNEMVQAELAKHHTYQVHGYEDSGQPFLGEQICGLPQPSNMKKGYVMG